jgi:hypothetical protein
MMRVDVVIFAVIIPDSSADTGYLLLPAGVPDALFAPLEGSPAGRGALCDPDVADPVASFIGADGTNLTPNSGCFSIILAARPARARFRCEIIARLRPQLDAVAGIDPYPAAGAGSAGSTAASAVHPVSVRTPWKTFGPRE